MGLLDKTLAASFEAGGPSSATGSQIGKDIDRAARARYGVPMPDKEGRRAKRQAYDDDDLSAPSEVEKRYLDSLNELENLVKGSPAQAADAQASAKPKIPAAILAPKKPARKTATKSPFVDVSNVTVEKPQQISARRQHRAVLTQHRR